MLLLALLLLLIIVTILIISLLMLQLKIYTVCDVRENSQNLDVLQPTGLPDRLQWGASAWQRGDFILHLAGCPLVETPCREVFEDVARWVEEVH